MPITPAPVPFEQALQIVAQAAEHARREASVIENLPLLDCVGRILAAPILADRDQPPFHRSTRDGFAVQSAALNRGTSLRIAGQVRAGQVWSGAPVNADTAVEIMTGAPLPTGADSVVMIEHVALDGNALTFAQARTLNPGENIVPQASEASAGQHILAPGTRISAAEIALAASSGCSYLPIAPKPRVAIVATGDELVPLDQAPAPFQIRNSNTYALAAMVAAAGGHPGRLPIARDTRQDIRERIGQGRMWDLLILSGGVSMGAYDLVEEVLAEFGAQFLFTGVEMQPGKPVVFGRLPARRHHPAAPPEPECYFFGLPGNPISTQVTFHCFVEPFLRALAGEPAPAPRWAQATLAQPVAPRPGITRLLPARLQDTRISITPWQGSGDLTANARASCYAELLPGASYSNGDIIRILLR